MMQCARTLEYQIASQKLKCYIPVISRLFTIIRIIKSLKDLLATTTTLYI